jgi:uncharacterized protein DUF4136
MMPLQNFFEGEKLMKIRTCWALIVATVLLTATAGATIITDYDHHANFSNYKTYSWGRVETANSIWDQRVKNAIDSQLVAKGWRQVESGGNVVVNAIGITRVEQEVHVTASGWGGGWGPWGALGGGPAFGDATGTKDTYAVGTLIVEIRDATSKNMVWWSLSDKSLPTKSDKAAKNLDKDVEKMFKHFPPNSGR